MPRTRSGIRNTPLTVLAVFALATACSPSAETKRLSPLWLETETAFADGRFEETLKNLDLISQTETARRHEADVWRTVTYAALAQGFLELSDAYEEGSAYHHHRITSFRQSRNAYHAKSRGVTLNLAQIAARLPESLEGIDTVRLDFPFPEGSSSPSSLVAFVRQGTKIGDDKADTALSYTLKRGAILAVSDLVGYTGDEHAARELFNRRPVHVPKAAFLAFVGRVLYEQAELFAESRINDDEKRDLMFAASEKLLDYARLAQARQATMLDSWRAELTRRASLDEAQAR